MDDKNGINACKLLGIPFTVGALIRMHEKELLTTEQAVLKLPQLGQHGRCDRFSKMRNADWRPVMTKTMSIRMDRENFEFLNELTKGKKSDLSKAVRDMGYSGEILFGVERYKRGEASLGRAAELAGVPIGRMMMLLTEFGVESRIEQEDYLRGLESLRKAW